jgi:hypothetical protein
MAGRGKTGGEGTIGGYKHNLRQNEIGCRSEAQAFARRNVLMYSETSAKTGYNVDKAFIELATAILELDCFAV